jgi:AAA+ ATPase superfamily predicted ATPase
MVIKALNTQNPFSDYGQLIKGKRFAGRKQEIQTIRNRVIGDSFGNIAVMGMPRVGKSSLVWNALMTIKEEQIKKNNLIITIYVGEISTSIDFFKQIVHKVVEELEIISNILAPIKS